LGSMKRGRGEIVSHNGVGQVSTVKRSREDTSALAKVVRTSDLLAPIVKLRGHDGGVNAVEFSKDGKHLVSASSDKRLFLWNVFGDAENYAVLQGHSHSVQDASWSTDGEYVVSCSADKTVRWWDCNTADCIRVLNGHNAYVNCCAYSGILASSGIVASGGDDKTVRTWDPRTSKKCVQTLKHPFEVTSLCYIAPEETPVPLLFSGGIDGAIRAWDLRKSNVAFSISEKKQSDGIITGLCCSSDSSYVLSNASDGSVCTWDVRAFVKKSKGSRFIRKFNYGSSPGPGENYENVLLGCTISNDCKRVAVGMCDRTVPIWNAGNGDLEFRLPGHTGAVMDVSFHPEQSIIASCSLDKTIYLGEIDDK